MRQYFPVFALVSISSPGFAQDVEVKCKPSGHSVTEATFQVAYNHFKLADNTITSIGVSERICERKAPVQWTIQGAVDRVVSDGQVTTAARIGGGVLYRAYATPSSDKGLYSSIYVGANAYVGYEDYYIATLSTAGLIDRHRGQRLVKIFDAVGAYTLVNLSDQARFPPSLGALRVETRASYVDKRAPNANLPVSLKEGYYDASAALGVDQFLDWGMNGAKLEYRVAYEHFFTDKFAVDGFTTLRLQLRPQGNSELEYPDRFAVSLAYSFANHFHGVNLSISKAF